MSTTSSRGNGFDVGAQQRELLGQRLGEHVGAGRGDLAELHEHAARFLEHDPEPARELGRLDRGRRRVPHVHQILLAGVVQHLAEPAVGREPGLDLADRVEEPPPDPVPPGFGPARDQLEDDADRHRGQDAEEEDQRDHDFGSVLVVDEHDGRHDPDGPSEGRGDHPTPEPEVHAEQPARQPADREDERDEHEDVDDDRDLHRAG